MNLETLDSVRLQLTESLDTVQELFPEAIVDAHLHTNFETYSLPEDDPALLRAKTAMTSIGLEPYLLPSGGGTDGNIFRRNGIASVVVGMADNGMHTKTEYVTIPDLVDAAHFCEALIRT
jgi:tripeptide aminopeptidase